MITNPSADQLTCGFPKNKNRTAGKTHHPLFAKYNDFSEKKKGAANADDSPAVV